MECSAGRSAFGFSPNPPTLQALNMFSKALRLRQEYDILNSATQVNPRHGAVIWSGTAPLPHSTSRATVCSSPRSPSRLATRLGVTLSPFEALSAQLYAKLKHDSVAVDGGNKVGACERLRYIVEDKNRKTLVWRCRAHGSLHPPACVTVPIVSRHKRRCGES
jgi:hypothetical protein